MIRLIYIFLLLNLVGLIACKKFLEIPQPKNEIVSQSVFDDAVLANSAMIGIYIKFGQEGRASLPISFYAGSSSDELKNYAQTPDEQEFYLNSVSSNNGGVAKVWRLGYNLIFQCNSIIDGVREGAISDLLKQRLTAEAKFNRAFWYFYLVNFFGDVPLAISPLYKNNTLSPRTSIAKIYDQIVSDLKDAEQNLPEIFVGGDALTTSNERVRPNKWAAKALLARVYLYMKDYSKSADQASTVIGKFELFELESNLDKVFLKNVKEQIWQLQPSPNTSINTIEGFNFILQYEPFPFGDYNSSCLSEGLLFAFEKDDARKAHWINYFNIYPYPYKYKVSIMNDITEYSSVLRLSEQFLIRAESRAYLGDLDGAKQDLNLVRSRAHLSDVTSTDKEVILKAILKERQIEFFSEWGHRWLDLKRTGKLDEVMKDVTIAKGGQGWRSYQNLWPIPQSERGKNPNLTQNPGYTQ